MSKEKLIFLIGLPASGKSTYAKELSKNENATILSSDNMRHELYGDVNHQDNNGELFQELYKRAKRHLKNGQSVIIDSTNISQKRRINTLKEFKNYYSECYYFNTRFWECVIRDRKRDREVGEYVIDRMYRSLSIPTYTEGWDNIHLVHDSEYKEMLDEMYQGLKDYLENIIQQNNPYDVLFAHALEGVEPFDEIYELPHDSKYHSLSISRHTYHVWEYILENYHGEDRLIMLWAALLHDVGKAHTKKQKEGSRYFQYIGHENVSGQLTCDFLYKLGYDDEFIMKVVELVQLHMRLLQLKIFEDDENTDKINQLWDFVGNDVFQKLKLLREADTQAH